MYNQFHNLLRTRSIWAIGFSLYLLASGFALANEASEEIAAIRGALSGSWYDPSRDGEGFVFELSEIPSGTVATVYWFTHKDNEPYWLIGSTEYDPEVFDDVGLLEFDLLEVSGTGFGGNFDSDDLVQIARGTISFVFEDCSSAVGSWTPESGSDHLGTDTLEYDLERITMGLDGVDCDFDKGSELDDAHDEAELTIGGNYSGSWFDDTRNGEGFVFEFGEILQERRILSAFWFTHKQGKPYWLLGTAEYAAGSSELSVDLFEFSGTGFGTEFVSSDVEPSVQGSITFRFTGCDQGLAVWEISDNQSTGLFDLSRITQKLDDIDCSFSSPERLSISTQALTNRDNPIDLEVSASSVAQGEFAGMWIIRTSDGNIFQEIPFEAGASNKTIDIDKPGFYDAILFSSNPMPRISNVHHFAVTTPLSGNILNDTDLRAIDSPYQLMGTMQIRQGSTLTMPRGTVIFGNGHAIQPFGTLSMDGQTDNPVILYQTDLKPGNTQSEGPYFEFNLNNLIMIGGSFYAPTGLGVYGSLAVKDSVFLNLSDRTYIWYPTSKVSITENIFWGTNEITFGVNDTAITLRNNLFRNYSNLYYKGFLQNWANYQNSDIMVEQNSFLDVGKTTLGVRSDGQYAARRNYWGTTDRETIQDMIFDGNDDFAIPQIIDFEPFLLEPHPDTPTLENCRARIRDIPTMILNQAGSSNFCD